MQPKSILFIMKHKTFAAKALRASFVTALTVGSVFGLNSCRDEFTDEDALRLELERQQALIQQQADYKLQS